MGAEGIAAAAGTPQHGGYTRSAPVVDEEEAAMLTAAVPDLTAWIALAQRHEPIADALLGTMAERRRQWDATLRAFVHSAPYPAHPQPQQPLAGAPIAVKDMMDVAGMPTTLGSRAYRWLPDQDAEVVACLRRAGATVVGKTNTHELALGALTPPTRNPWNTERIPGGSSGGSATAVAAGMALAALGTDTAGSVRIPAAACGVVGFKPTAGTFSLRGVTPLALTLDHVGTLTHSVRDAALLLEVLGGQDTGSDAEVDPPDRLVVPWEFLSPCRDDVRRLFVDALNDCGLPLLISPVAMEPWEQWWQEVFLPIRRRESFLVHCATLADPARRALLDPVVAAELEQGFAVSDSRYLEALQARLQLQRIWGERLGQQVLAMPTLPLTAPPVGTSAVELDGSQWPVRELLVRFTVPWAVLGFPAVSLPIGRGADGLPVGLQLVAAPGRDRVLLGLAARVEQALGRQENPPAFQENLPSS